MVYAFAGPWLPGFLSHGGVTGLKFVDQQMLTTEGVFGIPTLVSTSFIFLFVLFGAVMLHGGLLGFFTDLALAVAGDHARRRRQGRGHLERAVRDRQRQRHRQRRDHAAPSRSRS